MKSVLLITALAIIAGAMPIQAQNQSPGPVFRSRSDLVLVPVIVRDKRGEHIPGLTAHEFRLEDNGAAQKVASKNCFSLTWPRSGSSRS